MTEDQEFLYNLSRDPELSALFLALYGMGSRIKLLASCVLSFIIGYAIARAI